MELSKEDTKKIKGIAILFLVFLHLFNTKDYMGNFQSILIIKGIPIEYYLSLVSEACVSLYLFCSGYGLFVKNRFQSITNRENLIRIFKIMINYWIILILFVFIGLILGHRDIYPGNLKTFLMNFFLLSKSYNGAWWFLQSYVILIILSPKIIKLVNKNYKVIILSISAFLYCFAVLQEVRGIFNFNNNLFLQLLLTITTNFLSCQFSFILGMFFAKQNLISKIRIKFKKIRYKKLILFILIIYILLINIVIENFIIDPITAVLIICLFSIINFNKFIERILLYLSEHSTNIWLTHMFFYMIFFKELVYFPKYSFLVFIWLMILCLITSKLINYIYIPIWRKINNIICIKQINT